MIKKNSRHFSYITILLLFLAFVSFTSVNGANPIHINNSTDGGIKNAVDSLNNNDTLLLDNGVYFGENNTNIQVNKNITIIGKDKQNTIIDGKGISGIFNISSGNSITLINITIKNGHSNRGGAIYSEGTITLENCIFMNNTVDYDPYGNNYGGAIAVFSDVNDVNIINSTFDSNNAIGPGGAIYFDGKVNGINIINSSFYNNTCYVGGAIFFNNSVSGNTRISNSKFENNNANGPGGAICFYNNVSGFISIVDSYFIENHAFGVGGAIYFLASVNSSIDIFNSIFNKNNVSGPGGAIQFDSNVNGNLTIFNSSFENNSVSSGIGALLVLIVIY
ncbi:hypothetical protein SDC9_08437 [bioreactor metagenome]|uniref:Right handed beta helix domain-containing protein n=1 Tax=bioreactor metagenome TaxID=1076179 RepID=A0A644T8L4_9ZZZZ|nr:hypothetical protein [Methanobrevibacter sp.]MEA4957259.1 hypothetical protein [Methanobrevibacter sp.]